MVQQLLILHSITISKQELKLVHLSSVKYCVSRSIPPYRFLISPQILSFITVGEKLSQSKCPFS